MRKMLRRKNLTALAIVGLGGLAVMAILGRRRAQYSSAPRGGLGA